MGNNPSSSAARSPGVPPPASAPGAPPAAAHDSPRPAPRTSNRHPHPVHTQRLAAPPEPSLAQAQGSNARPKSMPPLGHAPTSSSSAAASPSPASSLHGTSSSRPTDIKTQNHQPAHPRAPAPTPASYNAGGAGGGSSHPVAVPQHHPPPDDAAEPLSPYADSVEAGAMVPQNSVPDMFNLTRPPRLPLPIEEEIHTPGSPIIAPADLGEPVGDVSRLDGGGGGGGALARTSSDLSASSADDDDAEELIVDKNRPTVPTRIEWRRGGNKIYVTGTIFQWNRKHRLHPV